MCYPIINERLGGNMKQYLEIGKVNNTHGLKGEIKLSMWCDDIDYLKQLKTVYLDEKGRIPLTLINARSQKNIAILKFAEITSVEQAQELKNKVLYCNRDDATIDDGAYYLADVIGCKVVDVDTNEDYGKIVDVMNYGAGDIYDVKKGKKDNLIPVTDDIVKKIDTENGVVKIKPMKGLFDED